MAETGKLNGQFRESVMEGGLVETIDQLRFSLGIGAGDWWPSPMAREIFVPRQATHNR